MSVMHKKNFQVDRAKFSTEEILFMQNFYNFNRKPNFIELDKISIKLGISIEKIKIWFQNRRTKLMTPKSYKKTFSYRLYQKIIKNKKINPYCSNLLTIRKNK